MQHRDIQTMTETEAMAYLASRIEGLLSMPKSECGQYATKIYAYYKRLNVFPKTPEGLSVSLKALVQGMREPNQGVSV